VIYPQCRSIAGALVLLVSLAPTAALEAQQNWRRPHLTVQFTNGGTDANYRACNNNWLMMQGASVELGAPYYAEGGVEMLGWGGEDCLPVPLTPGGRHLPPTDPDPTKRYWLGAGRRMAGEHLLITGRIGVFSSLEPWTSVKVTATAFHVTLGGEIGQVRARWSFEDGTHFHRGSTFGGLSIGLRL
jgi:hypothetical protein